MTSCSVNYIKLKNYVAFWWKSEIFGVKIEIFLKAFLSSGIKDSTFNWCKIRAPIDKDHFADGHFILIGELKVKNTETVLFIGKRMNKFFPWLVFWSYSFHILHYIMITIFYCTIWYTMYRASTFLNLISSNLILH